MPIPVNNFAQRSHWRHQLKEHMQDDSEESQAHTANIGKRLQDLRMAQGFSLRALAERSGLNINTLSLIENEKTSPNVNTLQQLSEALNVPITAFFETHATYRSVVHQKAGARPMTSFPQGSLEDLGGGLALGEATPLLMTLEAGQSNELTPIVHTGQEFIYCIEGSLSYWIDDQEYLLEPGDSLIFEAYLPHRWKNPGVKKCLAILVICPADYEDRSITQHLSNASAQATNSRPNVTNYLPNMENRDV